MTMADGETGLAAGEIAGKAFKAASPGDPRLSRPACAHLAPLLKVHENPWFFVMDRGGYFTVEHRQPRVIVLPVVEDSAVVMVRRRRSAVADFPLDLPAGAVMPGESAQEAAARELARDTGVRVPVPDRFIPLPPIAGSPGRNPLLCNVLQVDITHDEVLTRADHDEDILGVEILDYRQAARLLNQGGIYAAAPMAVLGRHLLARAVAGRREPE